jgi:hypothetical protein
LIYYAAKPFNIVMRRTSYKQIKDKQQKQRSIKLATEVVRKLRKPKLYDNAPKKVKTQQAPPLPRPQGPRVFTQSLIAERVATRRSQESHDTLRRRRRWPRSAGISPGKTFTTAGTSTN